MHITTFETFIAFSENGKSFLLKEKQFGPEGGGSLGFLIVNAKKKKYERFEISSNFGVGNGSVPQTIPAGKCRTALKKLSTSLSRSGFTGLEVCPESCKTEEREQCLSVSQDVLTINKQAFFGREGENLVQLPFSIQVLGKDLALFKDNLRLLLWTPDNPPDVKQMQAWMSPGNCLIVLFSFVQFNNHHMTDILSSSGDDLFKRLTFKDLKET